ncbi:MAG TPA: FAD-dependent oxidoreductase [Pirellulaceae bacterium]|nr:FAD-dependent oxidoreductase [Pirellulaceae bacterium]
MNELTIPPEIAATPPAVDQTKQPPMKLAIIGAGISGLVAAYRLHREHDITVFEANDYVGGHTNTIPIELDGEHHAIDTGFIVYNDWTYPNFIALLDELGVASQPTKMSFSVRDDRSGLEYNGESLNTLFAQRRNLLRPSFYRLIADILRFNREAQRLVAAHDEATTVGEFLSRYGYSRPFAEQYLLPMGAAIWSCPIGTFSQFPIRFIVDFYRNHGLLSVIRRPTWRVIVGGSQTYVQAMTRGFGDRIRLRTPVRSVRRLPNQVIVQPRGGEPEPFEQVIFACHSDQALRILGDDATATERDILAKFPYGRNVAVLHTDSSLLPQARRAWAAWNYRVRGDDGAPASVTYNMNILQGLRSRNTFCVTLNDETSITPARVLRRFEYDHPIFTTQRAAAQARHAELLNVNRTSYCGAYWRNGFHEDGVVSALAVVNALRSASTTEAHSATSLAGVAS